MSNAKQLIYNKKTGKISRKMENILLTAYIYVELKNEEYEK